MKSIFKIIIVIGLLIPVQGQLMAQKIGHVNVNELMAGMPEITKADQEVAAYQKELENELINKNTSLQTKYQEFQAGEATMQALVRESRIQEIQEMEKQIQNFQLVAQQQLEIKIQDLQIPIRKKVIDAIATVAKAKGYAYILDVGQGTVPYFEGGTDVTDLVKAKL